MAEQNKIFPEGDLKQNRMYIENFDDFKEELLEALGLTDVDENGLAAIVTILTAIKGTGWTSESLKSLNDVLTAIKGVGWSTETLKAIKDALTSAQSTIVEDSDDMKGTGFVKDTHSLKNIKDLISSGQATQALETTLTAIKGSGWSTESLKVIKELLDSLKLYLPYRWQPSLVIDNVTPIINEYYDALPVSVDVEVWQMYIRVADTGETLQVDFIVDGRTFTGTQAAVAGTVYYVGINSSGQLNFSTSPIRAGWQNSGGDSGHSYQIRIRKTTSAGTGTIRTVVDYKQRKTTA